MTPIPITMPYTTEKDKCAVRKEIERGIKLCAGNKEKKNYRIRSVSSGKLVAELFCCNELCAKLAISI